MSKISWNRSKVLICPICGSDVTISSHPDKRNELISIFEIRCVKCKNVFETFFKVVKLIIILDNCLALELDKNLLKLPGRKLEIGEIPDITASLICQEHNTFMNTKTFFKQVNSIGKRFYMFNVEVENTDAFRFFNVKEINTLINNNKVRETEIFMLDLIREAFL